MEFLCTPNSMVGVQAKAQAATKGTNLVDVESERVKEVVPKAGSMELLGHEDQPAAAAAGVASSPHCTFLCYALGLLPECQDRQAVTTCWTNSTHVDLAARLGLLDPWLFPINAAPPVVQ